MKIRINNKNRNKLKKIIKIKVEKLIQKLMELKIIIMGIKRIMIIKIKLTI